MTITAVKIYRYPVKGLTAEALSRVPLSAGRGLPNDRRFALTLGTTPASGPTIPWMPKTAFLSLLRHEKLAKLTVCFEDDTGILSVEREGKPVAKGNVTTPVGRAMIEEFFAAYMGDDAHGRPKLVECEPGAMLSDVADPLLSIINLASIKDLERVSGTEIDPLRFRANVYLQGLEPWAEFDWIGKDITLGKSGDGATLTVTKRIDRCAATGVNPGTGKRDLNLVKDLKRGFGHIDMGIYAAVTMAGDIAAGDSLSVP
ncbi:MAG: MOSC domain-containing protein [Alphaproteobacteria bacterium]|nr:MOSC domain-containing protein [Alphaproteobacteria bacterium]